MKNWNWKQWTGFGLICAVVIAFIVLHLVQPVVSYAFCECLAAGTFVIGAVAGYLLKDKNIIKTDTTSETKA